MESIIDELVKESMIMNGSLYPLNNKNHSMNFMKYLVRYNEANETTSQLIYLTTGQNTKTNPPMVLIPKEKMIDLTSTEVKKETFKHLAKEVREIYEQNGRVFASLLYFVKEKHDDYVCWEGQKLKAGDIPSLMGVASKLFVRNAINAVTTMSQGKITAKPFALAYHWKQLDRYGKLTPPHIHLAFAIIPNEGT